MKTLLILAYECEPYHRTGSTIGAQRPYQFAKHLPAYGWRSIVLCCDFKSRYSLDKRSDWKPQIASLVSEYLNLNKQESVIIPLPSLKYSSWVDRIWHCSVVMDGQRGTFSAKPGMLNGIRRRVASLIKLLTGDHSESWQPVAGYAGQSICSKLKIDMIMAEHSPDASVFVANTLYHKLSIPWIIDFRDPMMRNLNQAARFIYRNCTIPKFKSVSGTINVNEFWVSQDEQLFNKKTCVVRNGFDPEEFELLSRAVPEHKLRVGYFGNIQEGQHIQPFLESLLQLPSEVRVEFVFRGDMSKSIKVFFLEGLPSNISLDCNASVPRDEALSLMASCDILLLLSLKRENDPYLSKGVCPGKTFEYFALHKPILLSVGDDGLLDDLIITGGVGRIGKTSEEIAFLLKKAFNQKSNNGNIWHVKYDDLWTDQFTRKHQTEILVNFIASLE